MLLMPEKHQKSDVDQVVHWIRLDQSAAPSFNCTAITRNQLNMKAGEKCGLEILFQNPVNLLVAQTSADFVRQTQVFPVSSLPARDGGPQETPE